MAGSNPIVGVDFQVDITSARANLGVFREELKRVNTAVSESKGALKTSGDEYNNLSKHVDNLKTKQSALSNVISAQKAVVNALKSADGDHTKEIQSKEKAIDKLEKQYNDVTAQIGKYETRLEALNTPYQKLVREQQQAEESVRRLSEQYKSSVLASGKNSEQSRRLAQELQNESTRANGLRDRLARLDAQTDELTDSTRASRDAQYGMSQALSDISHAINIARSVYRALARVIGAVEKAYIDTDNAIRNTAATFGAAQTSVEGVYDILREYNTTLDHQYYSTQQEADALRYFALAGYDVTESMDALGTALALAKISGNDMQTVVDQLTDNMTALGLEGTVTWREMADVMAQTSRTTNTNVQQLGEAYGVVGALWQEFPDDIYTLSTALGVLANAGFKGTQGGTKLRNMITKLIDPTKDGAAAMKSLGIEMYNSDGSARPLGEVLKDLAASLDGLTDEERQKALTDIFNTRDLAAAEALLNAIANGDWDTVYASIQEAEGAAIEMQETIVGGLGGATDELKAKWTDLKSYIGEVFGPAATLAVNGLIGVINNLNGALQIVIHGMRYATDEEYRKQYEETNRLVGNTYKGTAELRSALARIFAGGDENLLAREIERGAVSLENMEMIANQMGVSTDMLRNMLKEMGFEIRFDDNYYKHFVARIEDGTEAIEETVEVANGMKRITPTVDISQIKKATYEARDLIAKLSQTITVKANVKIPKVTLTTDDRGNINSMHYGDATISPYAKGGLLDRPTLALMGEEGKEAVVPLQNNLEWVDELARIITPVVGNAVAAVNRTDNRNYSRVTTVNQTINASRTDPFDLYLKSRMAY